VKVFFKGDIFRAPGFFSSDKDDAQIIICDNVRAGVIEKILVWDFFAKAISAMTCLTIRGWVFGKGARIKILDQWDDSKVLTGE
jgi:hypothetical protein